MSDSGRIIDIVDGDRFTVARVEEERPREWRVRTINGKVVKVHPEKDVLSLLGKETADSSLDAWDSRLRKIAEDIDIDLVWEAIAGDTTAARTASELARDYFGEEAGAQETSALARALIARPDRFRFSPRRGGFLVRGRNEVRAEEENMQRALYESEQKERAASRLARLLNGNDSWVEAIEDEDVQPWAELCVRSSASSLSGSQEKKLRAFLEEVQEQLPEYRVTARQIANQVHRARDPELEWPDLDLRVYGVDGDYPPEVIAEAESLKEQPALEPDVRDLRELYTFSIDGDDTADFDDALSVEKLDGGAIRLYVHITDVAGSVEVDSALEKEAVRRGTSLYLPDRRYPMFPSVISEGCLSLTQKLDRRAVTVTFLTDSDGVLWLEEVYLSAVRVDRNFRYDEVSGMFEEGVAPEELTLCHTLAEARLESRLAQGAIRFDRPEVQVRVDSDGEIHVSLRQRSSPADRIVEEAMLLTGASLGEYCRDRDVPVIYRVQDASPDQEHSRSRGRSEKPRPEYTLEPEAHLALGVPYYVQITSPVRRSVDMANQRQLVHYLKTGRADGLSRVELLVRAREGDRLLGRARNLENRARRYWLLRYLERRPGEAWPAVVVRQIPARPESAELTLVRLHDLLLTLPLEPADPSLAQGSSLAVQVRDLEPDENRGSLEKA